MLYTFTAWAQKAVPTLRYWMRVSGGRRFTTPATCQCTGNPYNPLMRTVIETPTYLKSIQGIWTVDEAEAFANFIAANPDAGDAIPGTSGLRKVRWTASGQGKRGGARVIYFHRPTAETVILLIAYTKAKFDRLPTEFLKRLKEQYDV